MKMKLIHPVGRKIENNIGSNFEAVPCACFCHIPEQFAKGQGKYDNCDNCGCKCGDLYHMAGSKGTAKYTERAS